MSQVLVNDIPIATGYLALSIVWVVCVLLLWPVVVIGFRRAYALHKRSKGLRFDTMLYWGHLLVLQILMTVMAVDMTGIYIAAWGTVNLFCVDQISVLVGNIFLYAFASSIHTFAVQRTLHVPKAVFLFKKYVTPVNASIAQILIIAELALNRVYGSAIVPLLLGVEAFFTGPTFFIAVRRLVQRLRADHAANNIENQDRSDRIISGVKKFELHTNISSVIIFGLAILVFVVYIPRLFTDPSRVYSIDPEFQDFTRDLSLRAEFHFNWLPWLFLLIFVYLLRRHWIRPSSSEATMTTVQRQKSGDGLSNPTTSSHQSDLSPRSDDNSSTPRASSPRASLPRASSPRASSPVVAVQMQAATRSESSVGQKPPPKESSEAGVLPAATE